MEQNLEDNILFINIYKSIQLLLKQIVWNYM